MHTVIRLLFLASFISWTFLLETIGTYKNILSDWLKFPDLTESFQQKNSMSGLQLE